MFKAANIIFVLLNCSSGVQSAAWLSTGFRLRPSVAAAEV